MTFAPNGSKVIAVSCGATMYFYDAATGKKRTADAGHATFLREAALSCDGKRLVSHDVDSLMLIWDAGTGKLQARQSLGGEDYWPCKPLFAPQSKSFAITDGAGRLYLYDANTGAKKRTFRAPLVPNPLAVIPKREEPNQPKVVCPRLFFPILDQVYAAGRLVESFVPERTVEILQFSDDGTTLLTLQNGGVFAWWDVAVGKQTKRPPLHKSSERYHIDLVSGNCRFTTDTGQPNERMLALWTAGRDKPIWQFKTPFIQVMGFDPTGKSLAILVREDSDESNRGPFDIIRLIETWSGKDRARFSWPRAGNGRRL